MNNSNPNKRIECCEECRSWNFTEVFPVFIPSVDGCNRSCPCHLKTKSNHSKMCEISQGFQKRALGEAVVCACGIPPVKAESKCGECCLVPPRCINHSCKCHELVIGVDFGYPSQEVHTESWAETLAEEIADDISNIHVDRDIFDGGKNFKEDVAHWIIPRIRSTIAHSNQKMRDAIRETKLSKQDTEAISKMSPNEVFETTKELVIINLISNHNDK